MSCAYWRNIGMPGGGQCLRGLYGGMPSLGTCRICSQNTEQGIWPQLATVAASARPETARVIRPGDLVSLVISHMGHGISAGCGCNEMRRKMNEWGWWGCWRRRAELVAWFVKKATEAGVAVDRRSVAGLIRTAIREAWRKRKG